MKIIKHVGMFILIGISFVGMSQTQADATRKAREKQQNANDELVVTYNKILALYQTDTVFVANFKTSQILWEQLRDAELKTKYPSREPGYYGSMHSMCLNIYLTELTNERITKLKGWIVGGEEGDGCAGTVRSKE